MASVDGGGGIFEPCRSRVASRGDSDTDEAEAGETARRLKAALYGSNRSLSLNFRLPGRAMFDQFKAEDGDSF